MVTNVLLSHYKRGGEQIGIKEIRWETDKGNAVKSWDEPRRFGGDP
jgi:hypothetical protein